MADGYKLKIAFEIETADGEPYFSNITQYEAMPYVGIVLIERKLVDMLSELVAEGEQLAAEKAAAAGTGV